MTQKDLAGLLPLHAAEPEPKHGDDRLSLMESVGGVLPLWPAVTGFGVRTIDTAQAHSFSEAFQHLGVGLNYPDLR
jgi:hypothetical protein